MMTLKICVVHGEWELDNMVEFGLGTDLEHRTAGRPAVGRGAEEALAYPCHHGKNSMEQLVSCQNDLKEAM